MKLNKKSFILLLAVVLIIISVAVFEKIKLEENTKDSSSSPEIAQSVPREEPNSELVQKKETTGSDEIESKIIKEMVHSDPIHSEQEIEVNEETEAQRTAEKIQERETVNEIESHKVTNNQENVSAPSRFSSREEAMRFVFSRFTEEEIAIYNRVAENGLTPEQQAMAIQVASSRFSAEEIAAIEAALGQ